MTGPHAGGRAAAPAGGAGPAEGVDAPPGGSRAHGHPSFQHGSGIGVRRPLQALQALPSARALAALAVVVALGCVFHKDGAFFVWSTHRAVLREIAVQGMLACGMTLVILSGGIDLSVGSVLSLAAVSFALFTMPLGWGPRARRSACSRSGSLPASPPARW